ncbi:MAG: hypothetical protein QE487_09055 [Fluviicola sp.]|jgi:hypothetical protein|nr:hypothetical protein [Fluviicola sp.]
MEVNKSAYIKILTSISIVAVLFHISILMKIVPYEITWGGKLKTDNEMYVFEIISILINSFFIFMLLLKGDYIKSFFSKKSVSIILWIFFVIFVLNTIGNLFAKTTFEKGFTILTLVNSILLWKINKTTNR